MNEIRPRLRRAVSLIVICCATFAAGCWQDFGAGGTGELSVPPKQLRDIDETDFSQYATTEPATTQYSATNPTTIPTSQPAARQVPITIQEVRALSLRNNLDIQVEVYNPTIARDALTQAEAQFESLFTTNANFSALDQPVANSITGTEIKQLNVTPGVQIPLELGGNLIFNVPMGYQNNNADVQTLNPAVNANPTAQLNLPLLQGFGIDANAQLIRVAFYQTQQAEARTKLAVIRVLAEAERVYWRLYAARRALEVRKTEYDLAVAQLERARRQVRAGVAAEVEVIRAESGVADRVEGIITAQNEIQRQQRDLKRIMNSSDLQMSTSVELTCATEPNEIAYDLDPNQLIGEAMVQRMELLQTELQIAAESANVAAARNGLLPLVSLQYTYTMNGLGNNFDDAWNVVGNANFQDNSVGLQVQIPIGNEAAKSRLRAALARRLQQLATREQQRAQIQQEIFDAVDTLQTSWQRIVAARQRVVLSTRTMDAEIRQFNEGLRTSTDVLNAQTDLANAALNLISNLTTYQIAQIDIAFATGTLLGASHVIWAPATQPAAK